jgi:hypothetical protein
MLEEAVLERAEGPGRSSTPTWSTSWPVRLKNLGSPVTLGFGMII